MRKNNLKFVLLMALMLARFAFAADDAITEIYDYARIFSAIGLLITASYAGYKHMRTNDPMARKEAWETLSYAIVGVVLVLSAPYITEVLAV
jgi:hypothetical protein